MATKTKLLRILKENKEVADQAAAIKKEAEEIIRQQQTDMRELARRATVFERVLVRMIQTYGPQRIPISEMETADFARYHATVNTIGEDKFVYVSIVKDEPEPNIVPVTTLDQVKDLPKVPGT